MSLDRKRAKAVNNLDVVYEDSLESAEEGTAEESKQVRIMKRQDSFDEIPSIELTPWSRASDIDPDDVPRCLTDDDLEHQINFSMFTLEESFEDDPDTKYKRKDKLDKGLTLNKSVANLRTPYNSGNLTSTWEEKAQNNFSAERSRSGNKLKGRNHVFNYASVDADTDWSKFKRPKSSTNAYKTSDTNNTVSVSSSDIKQIQYSDFETNKSEDHNPAFKEIEQENQAKTSRDEKCCDWDMKSNIITRLTKEKNDLKVSLLEVISDAEKLKDLIQVERDVKECQTEVSGEILTKEQVEEKLKESQLEWQKLNEQNNLLVLKEKAFLRKIIFNNKSRIDKQTQRRSRTIFFI